VTLLSRHESVNKTHEEYLFTLCLTHKTGFHIMAMFSSTKNTPAFNPNNLNIINAGTSITGDLSSEGDMRIDGAVKGYVSSKARLVLGPTSRVDGDIKAVNLELSGEVNGDIVATELLTIKATAKISGNIHSAKLIIEAGAEFNGTCSMKELKNALKIVNTDVPATTVTTAMPPQSIEQPAAKQAPLL
jgi:cytoskeletal protein CcmA (bactofilin family)